MSDGLHPHDLKNPEVTGQALKYPPTLIFPPYDRLDQSGHFCIYQGLRVSTKNAPKYVISLNIEQIKREPRLSVLTLICNLNCPIHQSFVNSRINLIFPFVCYFFNILFFLSLIYSESFFWCQVTSKTFMFSIFTNSC